MSYLKEHGIARQCTRETFHDVYCSLMKIGKAQLQMIRGRNYRLSLDLHAVNNSTEFNISSGFENETPYEALNELLDQIEVSMNPINIIVLKTTQNRP